MNGQRQTRTDRIISFIKDHTIGSLLVLFFLSLVLIANAIDAVDKVRNVLSGLIPPPGFAITGEVVPELGASVPSNLSITVLWRIEDDTAYQSSEIFPITSSATNLEYSIRLKRPPPDELLHVLNETIRLGVGFVVAFGDENQNRILDRGERIVGGVNNYAITYLQGELSSFRPPNGDVLDTLLSLPQGYAIAKAVPPEEHGYASGFDELVPEDRKRLNVTIPRDLAHLSFPNWS